MFSEELVSKIAGVRIYKKSKKELQSRAISPIILNKRVKKAAREEGQYENIHSRES